MKDIRLLPVVSLLVISTAALACNANYSQSDMFSSHEITTVCDEFVEQHDSIWMPDLTEGEVSSEQDYWAHWSGHIVDNPILTSGSQESHFGLGLWQPNDEESLAEMTYAEWIRSHGLQLSLGFGEPGKPKFRFDYQWHELIDNYVSFQLEVPF